MTDRTKFYFKGNPNGTYFEGALCILVGNIHDGKGDYVL